MLNAASRLLRRAAPTSGGIKLEEATAEKEASMQSAPAVAAIDLAAYKERVRRAFEDASAQTLVRLVAQLRQLAADLQSVNAPTAWTEALDAIIEKLKVAATGGADAEAIASLLERSRDELEALFAQPAGQQEPSSSRRDSFWR